MRKYFTWRCIGLHLLVVVLVPTFLFAGWWQYHVALGGNDLSWVYTVEWPFFAVYALYVWWKMIHDRTTMLDRLWAVKARAAADAEGKPLHQIPGWAMDKSLSREVVRTSLEAARLHELGRTEAGALGTGDSEAVLAIRMPGELASAPALAQVSGPSSPAPGEQEADASGPLLESGVSDEMAVEPAGAVPVIEARVIEDKVVVDEELDAYNRYLAELSWRDPPKRWRPPRGRGRRPQAAGADPGPAGSLVVAPQGPPGSRPELDGDEARPTD